MGYRVKLKSGKTVEAPDYWPNEEVARRMENARDRLSRPSVLQRMKDFLTQAWYKVYRIHEFLPEKPEFVVARTGFDALTRVGNLNRDYATRAVAALVEPFSGDKASLELFTDKLAIENELRNLDAGRKTHFGLEDVSREEIEAMHAEIDAEIANNPKVQAALKNRKALLDDLVPLLVEKRLLKPEALEDPESYFHEEVVKYANLNEPILRGVGKLRLGKAGFQKGRSEKDFPDEEEYDYLRNYVEAETKWLADARARLRTAQIRDEYFERDNIYDKLRAEAESKGVQWHDLVPDTHAVYVAGYGSPLYRNLSVAERFGDAIYDEALSDVLKSSELRALAKRNAIAPNVLARKVLALVKPGDVMVLQKEVVRQLEDVEARNPVVGRVTLTLSDLAILFPKS